LLPLVAVSPVLVATTNVELFAPYAVLLVSALVAATLLPAQSELVLAGLLATGSGDPGLLFVVATIGNTAGSVVNWAVGRGVEPVIGKLWFRGAREGYERAVCIFCRYGRLSLVFAWLPIIGDALTIAAGVARVPIVPFVALVAAGKAARYAFIIIALS
jgi:membrane protein YqaA with SNARE-associated domain